MSDRRGFWESLHLLRRDRRATGRLRQESLGSSLGRVLDLSAGGMRIVGRRAPRGTTVVDLTSETDQLRVDADVVWVKRRGLLRQEFGLRFREVDPAAAQTLTRMSLLNRFQRFVHGC